MFVAGLVLWRTDGNSALIALWVLGLLVFIPGFYFLRIAYKARQCSACLCLWVPAIDAGFLGRCLPVQVNLGLPTAALQVWRGRIGYSWDDIPEWAQ